MTREEQIDWLCRLRADLNNGIIFTPWNEKFTEALNGILEQEPCDDEYIKVPKKALKYRTAGMVAYNAEWLKSHFDIERAVICGVLEPCEGAISRDKAIVQLSHNKTGDDDCDVIIQKDIETIKALPPVTPQPKMGQWITVDKGLKVTSYKCSECGRTVRDDSGYDVTKDYPYCHCGAKMQEVIKE